jgi:hypothetical protein
MVGRMRDEATEEREEADAGGHAGASHGEPDKSAKRAEGLPGPSRAEVSNYEIVEHCSGSPPSGSSWRTTWRRCSGRRTARFRSRFRSG